MPYDAEDMVGSCPSCGVRYDGREHHCRIHAHSDNFHPMGAQFMDELEDPHPRRRYGQRLAEGFELLADSGWDEGDY
jgi:hypothetical protein